jgi:hypothetical protein
MSECKHEWKLTADSWFGTFHCKHCKKYLPHEKVEIMLNENAALKRWQSKAVDNLLIWLEGGDDIDFMVHADRMLRELCNCENELPPCRMCERLSLLEASHE